MRVLFAVLGALQAVVVFAIALPVWLIVAVVAAVALWRSRRDDDGMPRRRELDVAA